MDKKYNEDFETKLLRVCITYHEAMGTRSKKIHFKKYKEFEELKDYLIEDYKQKGGNENENN